MRTFVTTMAAVVLVLGFTAAVQAQGDGGGAKGVDNTQGSGGMSPNGMSKHKMSHKHKMSMHKKHDMMHSDNKS